MYFYRLTRGCVVNNFAVLNSHQNPNIMKKQFFLPVLLAVSFCSISQVYSLNIVSTLTGGNWNSTTTWVGSIIPSASDNVFIVGPVNLNIHTSCNNLTIQLGGILQNSGASHTLSVSGNLINDGIIRDASTTLILNVGGNIELRGETLNYQMTLNGAGNQSIYLQSGKIISLSKFNNVSGSVIAQSGLYFYNTDVDFDFNQLFLQPNSMLSFTGSGVGYRNIKEINIVGQSSMISLRNQYSIQSFTGSDLKVYGVFNINSNGNTFTGNTFLYDTLQNYGPSYTFQVNGNFTNYGLIRNAQNNLTMEINGNLSNYGRIENYRLIFTGANPQQVFCDSQGSFEVRYIDYNGSSSLIFTSDIIFYNAIVDLNNVTLTLPENSEFRLINNSITDFFRDAIIYGNNSRLIINGGFIQNLQGYNLYLGGMFRVGDNNSNFTDCILRDTLSNYGSSHGISFHGNFTNVGRIFNEANLLSVYCTGNVNHFGEWENTHTFLNGNLTQHLTFAPGSIFKGSNFNVSTASGNLVVHSDLYFDNTNMNFNFVNVTMPANAELNMTGSNKSLSRVNVYGNQLRIAFTDNCFLTDAQFFSNVTTEGIVKIGNNNCIFHQDVINEGILGNYGSNHFFTIGGNFTNYGTVENLTNSLTTYYYGDIINAGTFANYENRLIGTSTQDIRLIQGQSITSKVFFECGLGGSGFQWYKNDVMIPGATNVTLVFNQVTSSDFGYYYCTSSAGMSRIFSIGENLSVDFISDAPEAGSAPLMVGFNSTVTGGFPPFTYFWEFGDGYTSSDPNPFHEYMSSGQYTVILTLNDNYGVVTVAKENHVFVCNQPEPDFTIENICLGETAYFNDQSLSIVMEDSLSIRYANAVLNFSSQWDTENWGAIQILGEPDVYPLYGDFPTAWAPSTPNGPREWIELSFTDPEPITEVWIYETLKPGTVDSVYARNPVSGSWELLWSGTAFPAPLEARIQKIEFPETPFSVSEIRIALNTAAVSYWNEIDAVAIISDRGAFPSDESVFEWDINNDGDVDYYTKGNISHTFEEAGIYEAKLRIVNYGVCENEVVKTLSVNSIPAFIQHPEDLTVCTGTQAIFTAEAVMTGDYGFQYQWIGPFGHLSGETQAELIIPNATENDAGNYYLIAYNVCGYQMSNPAILTIQQNSTAFAGPDAVICEDESHGLYEADADHYSELLWETSGTGNFDDPQILHPVYTPSYDDILEGEVVLTLSAYATEPCVTTATSTLTLTVWRLPQVLIQPVSQTVCEGSDVEFTVEAGGTEPLYYQWYGPLGLLEGEENPVLQLPAVTIYDAGEYYVIINNACDEVYSEAAVLTVQQNSTAFAGPDAVICEDESHGLYEADADHYSELLWETSGTGNFDDPQILHPVYTPSYDDILEGEVVLTLSAYATEPCVTTATSTLTLTVWRLPQVLIQPVSQTVCEGSDVEFTVEAGGTEPLYYQWYGPLGLLEGEENPVLQLPAVTIYDAGEYYVIINNACDEVYSETALLTIQTSPTWDQTELPKNIFAACHAVPVPEILTATGNFGSPIEVIFEEIRTDGTCPNDYILTRSWAAIDSCGNMIVHSQVVTITDTQSPFLSNPANSCQGLDQNGLTWSLEVAASFDPAELENLIAVLYSDNCSELLGVQHLATTPGNSNINTSWIFYYDFAIFDECGNLEYCSVTYSGGFVDNTLELVNKEIDNGESLCYGATQTITTQNITVLPGGSLTLIAGQSIHLFPELLVEIEGYFHAYISNSYCTNPSPLVAAKEAGSLYLAANELPAIHYRNVTLYPNPTFGKFTIGMQTEDSNCELLIEIYSTTGERIVIEKFSGHSKNFDISLWPKGVYIIRVLSGEVVSYHKLIHN